MSKSKRYIPLTPNQVQLYRRERAIGETKRTENTNNALIALRRRNLRVLEANPQLKAKLFRFNTYIKAKKHEEILKVVNYLISDLYERTREDSQEVLN